MVQAWVEAASGPRVAEGERRKAPESTHHIDFRTGSQVGERDCEPLSCPLLTGGVGAENVRLGDMWN
jgi:hypothetical protein